MQKLSFNWCLESDDFMQMVSGERQGAGCIFRASTRDKAISIGVTGWVRNTSSGDVELVACGEENQLLELESWLQDGPPHADVDNVRSEPVTHEAFKSFSIRY